MNNKRLIPLTVCLILATVPGISSLILADIASEANTKAQQHFEKANELRKVADHNAAIAEYEKAISVSPKSKIAQDAQYWIGQLYFESKQFDAALSAFQKLLDEYPASSIAPSTKQMIERVQQAKKNKSLFEAVNKGDIEQVKRLIADGADVNATEDLGQVRWTPLIAAASGGNAQVVKVLLENGAKVDATDSHGYTPLYYALWTDGNDSEEIVRALIASGADVNKRSPSDKRYPPLAFAIWLWEGREGNVKALLDAGADVGVKDDNGLTALYWAAFDSSKDALGLILANGNYANTIHLAACRGDLSRVKTLIEEGTDVNARDEFGCTPLHWAVLAESPDVADFLIAKGADINAKDTRNLSPLMAARGLSVVELLVSKGVDIQGQDTLQGWTKLHMVCSEGDKDAAEFLIRNGADVNLRDKRGATPLWIAASRGHREIVELLIEKGADINASDGRREATPLLIAARSGHADVVELLIAKGADVNVPDNQGLTPLAMAKQGKHTEVVNVLRQHGAVETLHGAVASGDIDEVKRLISEGQDVNSRDNEGQTPLHLAANNGHMDVAELLITKGADIGAKDKVGQIALHEAAKGGHTDVAELLIGKGADVNTSSQEWESTPLHCAASKGHREAVELLIAKGANLEDRNFNGQTPLHLAAYRDRRDIASILLTKGADIEARTKYDRTPLGMALTIDSNHIHIEMAELLLEKGANIHARVVGTPLLDVAIRRNEPKVVAFLMKKGAPVPPIHEAAFMGNLDKVNEHLEKGVRVDLKDAGGFTPLHCAICGRHKDIVLFLIDKRADVNARTTNGRFPLTYADAEMAELLIARGASVRLKDGTGQTLLHWAVNRNNYQGDIALVKLFLSHGADVNAKAYSNSVGWEGWTPFHVACRRGNKVIVEMLISSGADMHAKTDKGYTPLSLAKEKGHAEVVGLLLKHGAKE